MPFLSSPSNLRKIEVIQVYHERKNTTYGLRLSDEREEDPTIGLAEK